MVFTIVLSIKCSFRKYNMKRAIWHITTHFVVEGHKYDFFCRPRTGRWEQSLGEEGREEGFDKGGGGGGGCREGRKGRGG